MATAAVYDPVPMALVESIAASLGFTVQSRAHGDGSSSFDALVCKFPSGPVRIVFFQYTVDFETIFPGLRLSTGQANEWNTPWIGGSPTTVWIDDQGRSRMELTIWPEGGVTREFLRQHFLLLEVCMRAFVERFG